jgi:hypothetical protein
MAIVMEYGLENLAMYSWQYYFLRTEDSSLMLDSSFGLSPGQPDAFSPSNVLAL